MPSAPHHLARRLSVRRRGEAGLAMLDVLLAMAIFALIAVIAAQGTAKVRERAYASQAIASVKDVSLLLSARITNDTALPAAGTMAGPPARTYPDWDGAATVASPTDLSGIENFKMTAGIEVSRYVLYADAKSFAMCMVHRTGGTIDAFAGYHSPSGQVVQSGTGTPPATGGNPCDGAA